MIRLIPNARAAWRMLSVQIAAGAVIFSALQPDQQAAILGMLGLSPAQIPGVLGVCIIVARLVDQPKTRSE